MCCYYFNVCNLISYNFDFYDLECNVPCVKSISTTIFSNILSHGEVVWVARACSSILSLRHRNLQKVYKKIHYSLNLKIWDNLMCMRSWFMHHGMEHEHLCITFLIVHVILP